MAWSGTYTSTITKKLNDLANSKYQPQYDDKINGTANQIANYGDYTSKYQPQIDSLANQIANYGDYTSKYQPQIESLMGTLGDWNYDPESDKAYQAYKTQYTNLGNQAMQDTLGQISARTGGMASSYAGTAAQQSYNNYMQQLSNMVPQLEQIAYNRAANTLNMYQNQDNTEYGRWNDKFNRLGTQLQTYQGLDQTDYGRWYDALQNLYNQNNMWLGMDQNAYNRYQGDLSNGYNALSALADYDATEYARYQDALAAAQAAAKAASGGSGGRSGSGSKSSGSTGTTGTNNGKTASETWNTYQVTNPYPYYSGNANRYSEVDDANSSALRLADSLAERGFYSSMSDPLLKGRTTK